MRHGLARAPLAGDHPWYVLIEASSQIATGFDEAFAGALEAAFEAGVDRRRRRSPLRSTSAMNSGSCAKSIPEAQIREGGSIKHDVSVAVGDVPAFIAEATKAVEAFEPGARVCPFGHLGDGNIHFNVSQPVGADKAAYLDRWDAMNAVVHGIVARMGGSFSAEHGVGRLKRDLLARTKDPGALSVMRAMKARSTRTGS